MRNTILKWILLIGLMAYSICIAVWASHEAASKRVRSLDIVVSSTGVKSQDDVTKSGVSQALKKKYGETLTGMPINAVRTREIERYLEGLKNLEDVQCVITADRRLEVRVVPMIPEIRVFTGNKSWYVNKDGKMVEANPAFHVDVPVVTGDFGYGFQPKAILPLARFIKNDKDLKELVSMIVARDNNNLLLVPRIRGHIINFGDTSRLAEKKQALLTFYRKVIPYKGWEEYDTISVKFKGQIVATRRNKALLHPSAIIDETVDPEEASLSEVSRRDSLP